MEDTQNIERGVLLVLSRGECICFTKRGVSPHDLITLVRSSGRAATARSVAARHDGFGWKKINQRTFTPIRRLPGGSAPWGVINTAATRGGKEVHSMGGWGTGPQGPIPMKKNPKNPEGENRLGRGPKSPHGELRSSHVLILGLKLWPLIDRRAYGCGAGIRVGVFGSTFFLVNGNW